MRILEVNHFLERVGGAEVYLHDLMAGMRARGHALALFAGDAKRGIDEPELCVVQRPEFDANRIARDGDLDQRFERFARAFRPDLVHVHNVRGFPGSLLVTIASLGVPVLQTVHDCEPLCPNSWCVWPDGTLCEGGIGQKCLEHGCEKNYPFDGRGIAGGRLRFELARGCFDRFVAPSLFLTEKLQAHGYDPVEYLPFWVDPAADAEPERPREPVALVVGRMVPEKGLEFLVRAWPTVVANVPAARLEIVGGGALEDSLKALAKSLGVAASVIFHGRVPHERVLAFLRTASVQVLPSIWCENAPIACFEGLAQGLPMVASAIGGLPAIVLEGETGLLTRPRDPADLARALILVLGDPARRRRLAEGCLVLSRLLTRARHFDAFERICADMLATPRRAHLGAAAETELLASVDAFTRQLGDVEREALALQGRIAELEGPIWKLLRKLEQHARRLRGRG